MAPVVLTPSSPEWPRLAGALRTEIGALFVPLPVTVEHIGSTAVPGLVAKPVLDLLLGAPSLAAIEAKIGPLGRLGFDYVRKYEREIPERRYFVRQEGPAALRVHLHGVELGARLWTEHLAFRDALRNDAALRDRYQALKLDLATRFADDKAAYTEAKGPFVREVLARVCRTGEAARPAGSSLPS